jgi:hypothetical protein
MGEHLKMTQVTTKEQAPRYVDINDLDKLNADDLHVVAAEFGIVEIQTKTSDQIIAEIRWTLENEELYQQVI